jgi:hypothetical protein
VHTRATTAFAALVLGGGLRLALGVPFGWLLGLFLTPANSKAE